MFLRLFSYFTSFLIGYLIGSFPTAFLLVKQRTKRDIREEGSKNIGAMNAFEVTNSKLIGSLAMIGDLLKGTLAVAIVMVLFGTEQQAPILISGVCVVLGHNYPVWLKFKGGRGLSTTAGVMLVVCWLFVLLWCAVWAVVYKLVNDLHKANIIASAISPLGLFLLPENILRFSIPSSIFPETAIGLAISVCILILLRHQEQIRDIVRSHN